MKKSAKTKRYIKWFWGIIITPFALFALVILLINLGVFGHMPTFEDLENPQSKLATEIYSENGVLLGTYHIENRSHVSYNELSGHLVKALIATEDARFAQHSGIDFRGLGRVFFKTVLGGNKRAGGGSTITQQLALNLFAERSPNRIKRIIQKLQEWVTAVKLERNYTKDEIIAMYFNTVPFGSNAFGIRSAAQTFFGKLPSQLNLEESALMVGVVNAPTYYSPVRNPERSLERRNLVLFQMKKYGYITQETYDSVKLVPLKLNYNPVDHNTGLATYFREMLRQTMKAKKPDMKNYRHLPIEEFRADSVRWENDALYGWCNKNLRNGKPYDLDRDGLKIYTTINSKMQKYAEDAVAEHLSKELQPNFDKQKKVRKRFPFSNLATETEVNNSIDRAIRNSDRYRKMKSAGISESEIRKSFEQPADMTIFTWSGERDTTMTPLDSIWYYKSLIKACIVAMEPHTGSVRAYVGGPNFKYFKFDNAWQGRRQVGSTMKPFLYTLAMMEGMTPCDRVINNRQVVIDPYTGDVWSPETSEGDKYLGQEVTLKWGLTRSSNNISAWLIQQVSVDAMIGLCRRMGITSFIDHAYAISLGACDLSPFEMVSAYNTYPSKGIHINPYMVTRIEDNHGNVLATFTQSKQEAMSQQTAYLMINMMQGVVNEGTGARVRRYMAKGEVAGKTGTTNKNSDGWFIGYTPKITAGVWAGNDDNKAYLLGDGARMALPIWGLFIQKVLADKSLNIRDTDRFEVPPGMGAYNLSCTGTDRDSGGNIEDNEDEDDLDEGGLFF